MSLENSIDRLSTLIEKLISSVNENNRLIRENAMVANTRSVTVDPVRMPQATPGQVEGDFVDAEPVETQPPKVSSFAELRSALIEFSKRCDLSDFEKLLKDNGVSRVPELESMPEKWDAILKAVSK